MIQSNFDLRELNTFGLHCNAKRFARFKSVAELRTILEERNNDPLLILGGGSNILFTRDFDGLVLKNEIDGFEVVESSDDWAIVESGGGVVWHSFVLRCIQEGLGGIENLSLIPGSVGASPMQNIGAYGIEIKDVFESLKALHIDSGEIHTFDHEQCQFGYRESVFKRALKGQYIILSVRYKLSKRNHRLNTSYGAIESELEAMNVSNPTIQDVSNAVIRIRQSKLPNPAEIGNAGSFFKNPVVSDDVVASIKKSHESFPHYPAPNGTKLAAGWLIDQAGWKGKTFGSYGVHKNQALVLVNYGESDGQDIYNLSENIIQDIKNRFGVELEREVNIL